MVCLPGTEAFAGLAARTPDLLRPPAASLHALRISCARQRPRCTHSQPPAPTSGLAARTPDVNIPASPSAYILGYARCSRRACYAPHPKTRHHT
eukprot:362942-Chlamydomonas_euryale.AAC.5